MIDYIKNIEPNFTHTRKVYSSLWSLDLISFGTAVSLAILFLFSFCILFFYLLMIDI